MRAVALTPVLLLCAGALSFPLGGHACAAQAAAPAATGASDLLSVAELPDSGPRREPSLTDDDLAALKPGMDALEREEYEAAAWAFRRAEEKTTNPALVPMARAYQAEAHIRREGSVPGRAAAVELYQSLVREFPESVNAVRAGWRLGDLFARQGWRIEAQAAYERSAREAKNHRDVARAMLGLGLTHLVSGQWGPAVQALQAVQPSKDDEGARSWAALGMAEGYYGLRRYREAAEHYRVLAERWPHLLRLTPAPMLHLGDLEQRQGREAEARRTWLQFYNLFPRHDEAPGALLKVADSFKREGRVDQAERFYGYVIERHREAKEASVAQLRLAEVGQATVEEPGGGALSNEVGALFRVYGTRAPVSPAQQEAVFEEVSETHREDELGTEALFLLADHHLAAQKPTEAIAVLRRACERDGKVGGDTWPVKARRRLAQLLRPDLAASIRMADDWQTVLLFHQYGNCPDWGTEHLDVILHLAEAHRRLGFPEPAIQLYQQVLRDAQQQDYRQHALLGLGRTYLDQRDAPAARRMFERYQLEYPLGPLKGEALRSLAESWAMMGDAAATLRTAERWFKWYGGQGRREPVYGEMLVRLADAQAALGRHADAIRTIRSAEEAGVMPFGEARAREAQAQDRSGFPNAAMAQWSELLRVEPRSAQGLMARLHMARAWLQQQRSEEAALILQLGPATQDDPLVAKASAVLQTVATIESQRPKEGKP